MVVEYVDVDIVYVVWLYGFVCEVGNRSGKIVGNVGYGKFFGVFGKGVVLF